MNTLGQLATLIKAGFTLQQNPDNTSEYSISGNEFYRESDDLRLLISSVYEDVSSGKLDEGFSSLLSKIKKNTGLQ